MSLLAAKAAEALDNRLESKFPVLLILKVHSACNKTSECSAAVKA